ncbi:hypothetical protein SK803_11440 [Lentzea sp. BCCO 10_0856]|uniref:Uncharacterized protein n=1 Tax=Lentzea miocenica TaxID=3095431 RepID=A0ABU4SY40_9PSEU|nr:hypothetical protein [Lentzea sp. BCCO 10_0856]MDX8030830.1 hypothetical protein [Lentzea sp. BCCO 10_0856]
MNEVTGWIFAENLTKVVEYVAGLVGYRWDDLDAGALDAGLPATDDDKGLWFEYPMAHLTLRIANTDESAHVVFRISGDFDEVFAARLETLLDLC